MAAADQSSRSGKILRPIPQPPDVVTEFLSKLREASTAEEKESLIANWKAIDARHEADLAAWVAEAPDTFCWEFTFPSNPQILRKAVISREPTDPTKWRVSHFDKGWLEPVDQWFASSHAVRDTKMEAVLEAKAYGATRGQAVARAPSREPANPRVAEDLNALRVPLAPPAQQEVRPEPSPQPCLSV